MFSLELALLKERFLPKSFFLYLGAYLLPLLFQFVLGNEQASVIFFPGLALLYGSSFWLVFLDDGKSNAYRKLLPSLPLGRKRIFLSHLQMRFVLWILGILLAYVFAYSASFFLQIDLAPSLVLYGIGMSFVVFGLINLSLQFHSSLAIGYIGGITGLSLGMSFSLQSLFMDQLQKTNLWGPRFLGVCISLGLLLTALNAILYLWRRP